MRINIVIDNKDSWLNMYVGNLILSIEKRMHKCNFVTKQSNIPNNSDITFFLGCEQKILEKTRKRSKNNIIIHESDLPKGKGMSPATWQIIEGKNKIPITLFEVSDKIDDGDFYLKDNFFLNGSELVDDWRKKQFIATKKIILKYLDNFDKLKRKKQIGESTFYRKRTSIDSKLNINMSLKSQFNLLRVVDNDRYPAYFIYKGEKYIIKIYNEGDKK